MDIAKMKRNRGRLSGFIMGLIASIYGGLFAFIIGTSILSGHQTLFFLDYSSETATAVAILLLLTSAITIVGAALIRGIRIVGGVLIIGASAPLFAISIIGPEAFSILGFTSFFCFAAGILAFIPISKSYLRNALMKKQSEAQFNNYIAQQQSPTAPSTVAPDPKDSTSSE